MKRSNPPIQHDLFSATPTPPVLASLEVHHDELVDLLSRLLWEVARGTDETMNQEYRDDQAQS